ncbi:MAG: Gfo/Idh/MocA family protein, partial [Verrucomicrobiia bacterium]
TYNPGPKFRPVGSFKRPTRIPPTSQAIPNTLNWDLWKGPTVEDVKYNEIYLPKSWRSFFQFGNGQLGDWACHTLDAMFWALELGMPSSVKVRDVDEKWPGMPALRSIVEWEFPRTGKAPLKLSWHEGYTPEFDPSDGKAEWGKGIGMAMIGAEGTITHGIRPDSPRLYPEAYWQDFHRNLPEKKFARIKGSHIDEWARAIKGDGPMPGSNFSYASRLTEMALLGVLAQKTQKAVEWDSENMRVTNDEGLNEYIREPVRRGWEMGQEVWG